MNTQEKAVVPFAFGERTFRTVMRDDEPWFVAKDVCDILDIGNPTETLRNFPEDEILKLSSTEVQDRNSWGGASSFICVNEPGLYRLIFQSRKDEAEAFKRWVFHEVLPSIRREGYYAVPQVKEAMAEIMMRHRLDLEQSKRDMTRLKVELAKIVQRNTFRDHVPEIIPDEQGRERFNVNLPIARFVAENLDFTLKDADIIPVYVAYQIYLAYTPTPVDEQAFKFYIADNYPDLSVTRRKADGLDQAVIKRCRFRVTHGAFKANG